MLLHVPIGAVEAIRLAAFTVASGVLGHALLATAGEPAGGEPNTATEETAPVVLHLRDQVELDSAIVRLSDIVMPVGPAPENWSRAAVATVALLPADGRRLRIERQRLSELLQQSKLISEAVRWSGPATVSVRCAPPVAPASQRTASAAAELASAPSGARPVAFTTAGSPAITNPTRNANASPNAEGSTVSASASGLVLPPAERNRILRMVRAAYERMHQDLNASHELIIDESQPSLGGLDGLRSVGELRIVGDSEQGEVQLVVRGETELERVEAALTATLEALPLAVVTTRALSRGDWITAGDVRLQPVPRARSQDDLFATPESLVGMEVKRPLSSGRLVEFADVARPTVIARGDLVDVRVVAGGVTVTTAARALGPAAAGEPISVETQSPRRRLIGRAVSPGIVEIVTRPPTASEPFESP